MLSKMILDAVDMNRPDKANLDSYFAWNDHLYVPVDYAKLTTESELLHSRYCQCDNILEKYLPEPPPELVQAIRLWLGSTYRDTMPLQTFLLNILYL